MTTTEQLREYLDAHGIDGAPTEPGWYVVELHATPGHRGLVSVAYRTKYQTLSITTGSVRATECARHAPLTLAGKGAA